MFIPQDALISTDYQRSVVTTDPYKASRQSHLPAMLVNILKHVD